MEELKTLTLDLHRVKVQMKTSYSKDLLKQYLFLFQEYEITVEDVSSITLSPRKL